jgi:hypothetical protein
VTAFSWVPHPFGLPWYWGIPVLAVVALVRGVMKDYFHPKPPPKPALPRTITLDSGRTYNIRKCPNCGGIQAKSVTASERALWVHIANNGFRCPTADAVPDIARRA